MLTSVLALSLAFIGLLKNVKSYDALKEANNLVVFSVLTQSIPLTLVRLCHSFGCSNSVGYSQILF